MDYVLLSDITRYYVVVVALWLIAVLLRLAYLRTRDYGGVRGLFKRGTPSPHPFSTLGLAVLMLGAILRRFESLGEPADFFHWLVFTGVTLVFIGVLINVRFTFVPPWRRDSKHRQGVN